MRVLVWLYDFYDFWNKWDKANCQIIHQKKKTHMKKASNLACCLPSILWRASAQPFYGGTYSPFSNFPRLKSNFHTIWNILHIRLFGTATRSFLLKSISNANHQHKREKWANLLWSGPTCMYLYSPWIFSFWKNWFRRALAFSKVQFPWRPAFKSTSSDSKV